MAPSHELLWLTGDDPGGAGLRALTRAHPQAARARHVSRSYCAPLALVAWHDAPLGVDLERVAPTDRIFAESICTPGELARFEAQLDDDAFVTSLWVSKEALAKALGDAVAYDPRRLESPVGWWRGAAGAWRAREFIPAPGHVAWLVWADAPQKSPESAVSAESRRRPAGRR